MASRGLKKRPVLEDLIGEGVTVRPMQRPYTELADDIRVQAYSTLGQDPAMWRDLEFKLHAARRYHDEVRWAAMSRGGEVGAHMAASGLGGAPAPGGTIVGDHDGKVEASIAADEAARREVIERDAARREMRRPGIASDINHFLSKSAVEQARAVGYGVGKTTAKVMGVPEIMADLAAWFAANGAQDAVENIEQLAQLAQDLLGAMDGVRERAERTRVENTLMPRLYGREDL